MGKNKLFSLKRKYVFELSLKQNGFWRNLILE